jgi:hypothetical protein
VKRKQIGERVWKDEYSANTVYFIHTYENGKMIPAETIPGMGVEDKGECWRG